MRGLRLLGRGGSTIPGAVALRVAPEIVGFLARRHRRGNVVVTGTNGKTTTTRMLARILERAGYRVAWNRTGANLPAGVAAGFLNAVEIRPGRGALAAVHPDVGLAEADEAAFPRIAAAVRPEVVVATNFFRDQLDRYGELARTVSLVREGVRAAGGWLVANADDPLAAGLAEAAAGRAVFFGLELPGAPEGKGVPGRQGFGPAQGDQPGERDVTRCLACGTPLSYDAVYLGHLGRYRCPACGFARPAPQVAVVRVEQGAGRLDFAADTPAGRVEADVPVSGLHNAYNAAAATATALLLGVSPGVIGEALACYRPGFGRLERVTWEGRQMTVGLVKNPAGMDAMLGAVLTAGPPIRLVMAINDLAADGRDVSWLWDAGFERLASAEGLEFVVASGLRAEEMALRLLYAGVPEERILLEPGIEEAVRRAAAATPAGGGFWVLPTYTALLGLRSWLGRVGAATAYWEV